MESLEHEIVGRGGSSLAALRKITPMSALDNPITSDLRVNVPQSNCQALYFYQIWFDRSSHYRLNQ